MKSQNFKSRFTAVLLVTAFLAVPGFTQFTSHEISQRDFWEEFLSSAKIVRGRQLSPKRGITQPYVLVLKKDGIMQKAIWKPIEGLHKGYLENWRWEIAAYRFDKYLGLNMVPPTVERRYLNTRGSIQLWVDAKSGSEGTGSTINEVTGNKTPAKNRSLYLQRAFDRLIGNEDRHLGNYLFTADGRMVLIDHSRSFRTSKAFTTSLEFSEHPWDSENDMRLLPASFVEKMALLDAGTVETIAGTYLTDEEIRAVLLRRDLVLGEIDQIIGEYGPSQVLY